MPADRSPNVVWQQGIDRARRWDLLGHGGATIWVTGLPGSGQSTIAPGVGAHLLGARRPPLRKPDRRASGKSPLPAGVEAHLRAAGRSAYVLDGDNLRHGLNGDLGFSASDRAENVRRTGEVSALLADSGVVVLVALVSPYRADRAAARAIPA